MFRQRHASSTLLEQIEGTVLLLEEMSGSRTKPEQSGLDCVTAPPARLAVVGQASGQADPRSGRRGAVAAGDGASHLIPCPHIRCKVLVRIVSHSGRSPREAELA